MKTAAKLVLLVLLLVFSSLELAFARKAVQIPISIRPPEPVARVIDLPDIDELKYKNGIYIDIGYRHIDATRGYWVGYVGSGHEFVLLSQERLKELMQLANMAEMPPPPGYFDARKPHPIQPPHTQETAAPPSLLSQYGSQLTTYQIYMLIVGAFLAFAALNAVVKLMRRSRGAAPEPGQFGRPLEPVMTAALPQNHPVPTPVVSSFGTSPGGAPATFGRRV